MSKKVIDLSQHNTVKDWTKVKKNCAGVILRVGYRGYAKGTLAQDKKFREYFNACMLNNIPMGLYFVTQAISKSEAIQEARYVHELAKCAPNYFQLPVFIDTENSGKGLGRAAAKKISPDLRTDIVLAFINECKIMGYKSGVYASESWFKEELVDSRLQDVYRWVAKYSNSQPKVKTDAWQYTSTGSIDGINGNVDISIFSEEAAPATANLKSNEVVAQEVIAGKWGNGETRKRNLVNAGYDYAAIQTLVNKLAKSETYHVIQGDTIEALAKQYGTTAAKIKELNKLSNISKIYIGMKLRVR